MVKWKINSSKSQNKSSSWTMPCPLTTSFKAQQITKATITKAIIKTVLLLSFVLAIYKERLWRADGYYQKDGKEYMREFLDDYYHGNIAKYHPYEKLQKIAPFTSDKNKPESGKAFGQLDQKTFEKLQKIWFEEVYRLLHRKDYTAYIKDIN